MYYAVRGLDDAYEFDRTSGEIYFFANGNAAWNYTSSSTLQRSIKLRLDNVTLSRRIEQMLLVNPENAGETQCRPHVEL